MTGLVHVYTGDGKGKTTAALGLALRAAGAGMRVLIVRFMKTADSSELASLGRLSDMIDVWTFGRPGFITGTPDPEDIALARKGFVAAENAIFSGKFQVVVLDEILQAVHHGLISADDVLRLIDGRNPHVEVVLTGRDADPRIVGRADIVTEMREVKHCFKAGIPARKGIDV